MCVRIAPGAPCDKMSNRIHLFVHGRVQGVGFRSWVVFLSKELNLTGWVRNTADGVEAVAEGPIDRLDRLAKSMGRGPGRVERVEVKWEDSKGEFKRFEVR